MFVITVTASAGLTRRCCCVLCNVMLLFLMTFLISRSVSRRRTQPPRCCSHGPDLPSVPVPVSIQCLVVGVDKHNELFPMILLLMSDPQTKFPPVCSGWWRGCSSCSRTQHLAPPRSQGRAAGRVSAGRWSAQPS